jgi:polysaccharide biosynthesis/export protein
MKKLFFLFTLLLPSCVSYQDLRNFPDVAFPLGQPEDIANQAQIRVQPSDALNIRVFSYDQEAAAPFNLSQGQMMGNQMFGGGGFNNQAFRTLFGYEVDEEGYIDFPVLGRLRVAGMTINQMREELLRQIEPYLKDATVNIQFINFRITILGEVGRPATYNVPSNRVSIFDALGLAGDLTPYANRTNVLIIREQDGQRSYGRLDLQNQDIFLSPYFYLLQNDVVYVEPIKPRVATVADPVQRWISYVSAGLSIVTLVIALTR